MPPTGRGQAPPLPYTDWLDSAAYSPDPRHPQGGGKPRPYIYSGCAEAYAPAAAWIFPLNGLAITGDVACSALEAMFIREVHFSSEQFKQTRGAHVDAGSCIASYAFLAIEANMRRFIDFEAYQLQALFDWLQIWLLALLE